MTYKKIKDGPNTYYKVHLYLRGYFITIYVKYETVAYLTDWFRSKETNLTITCWDDWGHLKHRHDLRYELLLEHNQVIGWSYSARGYVEED